MPIAIPTRTANWQIRMSTVVTTMSRIPPDSSGVELAAIVIAGTVGDPFLRNVQVPIQSIRYERVCNHRNRITTLATRPVMQSPFQTSNHHGFHQALV